MLEEHCARPGQERMDKRKVNGGGAGEDLDERASKRRKLPSVSALFGLATDSQMSAMRFVFFVHWRWSAGS